MLQSIAPLVQDWQTLFGSRGYFYYAEAVSVGGQAPSARVLFQSSPNPTASRTTIRFSLPRVERVRLTVLDASGCEIARLVEGERPAGAHAALLETHGLASGVYFYRLEAGASVQSRKLIVLR